MTMPRPTITIMDVARAAGVSKSAVSYALNGKPGVSRETRDNVIRIARSMGWQPNDAAKTLSKSQAMSVGMVLLLEDEESLGAGSFLMELLAGLSAELGERGYSVTLRMTTHGAQAACRIYEEWIGSRAVDASVVLDVSEHDPRLALFRDNPGDKALFLAPESVTGGLPTLYSADEDGMRQIVTYLHDEGHRRIARIAGPEEYAHTRDRDHAFETVCGEFGLSGVCLHGKYLSEVGRECCERLLDDDEPPTAIVCDADTTALAAMAVATERGVRVPDDLSIIAWEDTPAGRFADPNMTALHRDVVAVGRTAGDMVLRLLDGESVGIEPEPPYRLVVRGSSGPCRNDDRVSN